MHWFVGVAQRVENRLRSRAARVLTRQRREGTARAYFEQQVAIIGEQQRKALRKLDGLAQVAHPVGGVGGFVWTDPGAGQIGDKRPLWRVHADAAEEAAELGKDRLQHRRMRRHRDAHAR